MSNNAYKKRAKGNWQQGKGCKGDSEERQYAKKEIKTNDDDFLTPRKGKRKRNKKASLEHRINWYIQTIESREREEGSGDWFLNHLKDSLKKAQEEYKEKYSKKPPKSTS